MKAGPRFFLGCGFAALLALAGCGRSGMWGVERAAWRGQAEAQCMQSGAVKLGGAIVRAEPIEGPGVCGANFPLKVLALGESSQSYGYAEAPPRPPGRVGASMPDWPAERARPVQQGPANYAPPADNGQMRWMQGPPPANAQPAAPQYNAPQVSAPPTYQPPTYQPPRAAEPRSAPVGAGPMSIYPPGVNAPPPDDIPDDAIVPNSRRQAQPAYNEPPPRQASYTPPPLGPSRDSRFDAPIRTGAIAPATLTPTATLSCPIVSALDRWVAGGVQPAALRWFGSPVAEIKQISAYSCRQMNGAGGSGISEHAFGNALDIAGFTLADGRKISVQKGWRGTPEEQGFLHDVQLAACDTFSTVLAPGYNAAHYNHIHVDLMRRKSGRRPCRPDAIPGEVVAAKARAVYAAKNGNKEYTGSIGSTDKDKLKKILDAIPGADGLDDEDADDMVTGSIGGGPDISTGAEDATPAPRGRGWPIVVPQRASNAGRSPADF
ncbi:extensin family protein [Undibacter mobilis]|uniref:Extensin n=1 Tax=Undibacter mobilis TaxID=2292256 RepID=A0A371BB75_9BRAD|nr:extensin family protein [Undibacter mobilis]RDV04859.1 extensin [Undibacter mobilis]